MSALPKCTFSRDAVDPAGCYCLLANGTGVCVDQWPAVDDVSFRWNFGSAVWHPNRKDTRCDFRTSSNRYQQYNMDDVCPTIAGFCDPRAGRAQCCRRTGCVECNSSGASKCTRCEVGFSLTSQGACLPSNGTLVFATLVAANVSSPTSATPTQTSSDATVDSIANTSAPSSPTSSASATAASEFTPSLASLRRSAASSALPTHRFSTTPDSVDSLLPAYIAAPICALLALLALFYLMMRWSKRQDRSRVVSMMPAPTVVPSTRGEYGRFPIPSVYDAVDSPLQ